MQGEDTLLRNGHIILKYDNEPSPIGLSETARVRVVTVDGHVRFDKTFLEGLFVRRDPAKLVIEGDLESKPVVFEPLDRGDKVFIAAAPFAISALQ